MSKLKEKLKEDIFEKFYSIRANGGDCLPPSWLNKVYIPSLPPGDRSTAAEAILELVSQGFVEVQEEPFVTLILTEKGFNHIKVLPGSFL